MLQITTCVPVKLSTLSLVPGKKSLFWENFNLTPYIAFNSAITEPPLPINDPVTIISCNDNDNDNDINSY